MKVRIVLINDFGVYIGETLDVTQEDHDNIITLSKNYFQTGFEMTLEDGNFAIFSPELIKKSILKIEKIEDV